MHLVLVHLYSIPTIILSRNHVPTSLLEFVVIGSVKNQDFFKLVDNRKNKDPGHINEAKISDYEVRLVQQSTTEKFLYSKPGSRFLFDKMQDLYKKNLNYSSSYRYMYKN